MKICKTGMIHMASRHDSI